MNGSKNKLLLKYCVGGMIFISALGTLAHFTYGWSGENKVIGLFTAVNESTWEHMKLIYFPMLIYTLFVWIKLHKTYPASVRAMLISTLAGTGLIPVLFYTYTGILGFMITPVNLAIYYISVIISFILFYRLSVKGRPARSSLLLDLSITLLICLFFLYSYDPPELGIFKDPTIAQ